MKNVIKLTALFMAVVLVGALSSCEKEESKTTDPTPTLNANETAAKKLEGNWEVTSYTEDGVELMAGEYYQSLNVRFTLQTSTTGKMKSTAIYNDNSTDNEEAPFNIVSEGTTLVWEDVDYELTFKTDSKIELEGRDTWDEGEPVRNYIIKATKL